MSEGRTISAMRTTPQTLATYAVRAAVAKVVAEPPRSRRKGKLGAGVGAIVRLQGKRQTRNQAALRTPAAGGPSFRLWQCCAVRQRARHGCDAERRTVVFSSSAYLKRCGFASGRTSRSW